MSDKIKPHHLQRKAVLYVRQSSAQVVSRSWWKSETASRSGELSHTSRPLLDGRRRMTPWRGIAGVGGEEKARLRS